MRVCSLILYFLLQLFLLQVASSQNCNVTLATNIDYYILKNSTQANCGCETVSEKCIRKCCLPGFVLTETEYSNVGTIQKVMECVTFNSTKTLPLKIKFYKDRHYVETKNLTNYISGVMNCELRFNKHWENIFPQKEDNRVYIFTDPKMYWDSSDLCIDNYYDEKTSMQNIVLKCLAKEDPDFNVRIAGMITSCCFLLVTFIILILQPQKNLHIQILLCYILNLTLAFICLIIIQLNPFLEKPYCAIAGFLTLFFFTSSIFWMNIICIDIYLTFAGFFGFSRGNQGEKKRMKYYFLYGILAPTLLIIIVVVLNITVNDREEYYPSVGIGSCFLRRGLPYLIYMHGPVGTLLIVNIILFILTAISIYKHKKAAKVLKSADSRKSKDDMDSFVLYLKLLLGMGLNWSLETISWAFNTYTSAPRWLWYLPNIANVSYGILIFFMFAWKKKHWKNIKQRYYQCTSNVEDMAGNESTQTNTTTASSTKAESSL